MKKFKIDNFTHEYPGLDFPFIRELSEEECCQIQYQLKLKLDIDKKDNTLAIVQRLAAKEHIIDDIDIEQSVFELSEFLRQHQINLSKKVILNWFRFDEIDEMQLDDLCKYFTDIWYPGVDDLDIFDTGLQIIISIHHHGSIGITHLNN